MNRADPPPARRLRSSVAAYLTTLAVVLGASSARAQPDPAYLVVTSDLAGRNEAAVARGVAYLKSVQNDDGSWGDDPDGGRTSLVALALLNAGESAAGDAVTRALAFVRRQEAPKTYAVGLRAAFAAQLPERSAGDLLRRELGDLVRGDDGGLYGYVVGQAAGDYSNSQYAALGAWYAAEAGLDVPRSYWQRVDAGWRAGQTEDGGWGYTPTSTDAYGSMTAAGTATLSITDEYLNADHARNVDRPRRNQPLERAVAWLGRNFAVDANPGRDRPLVPPPPEAPDPADAPDAVAPDDPAAAAEPPRSDPSNPFLPAAPRAAEVPPAPPTPAAEPPPPPKPVRYGEGSWINYMLFGYERVGEATGLTRFGDHDWFAEGATFLLDHQSADGSWNDAHSPDVSTAYALLFLARGRAPVAFQKLAWDGRWNDRPRDVARAARWLGRQVERHLNWQVLPADARPADWDQSPVVYVAGHRPISMSDDDKANLRAYVRRGGLLVFVNEGENSRFADSVRALCAELFAPYEFRELPDDHPLVAGNYRADALGGPVLGLSNGVRELAVLLPRGDASYRLHAGEMDATARRSPFGLMGNLFLYATGGRPPRVKGQRTWVDRDESVAAAPAGVRVVRLLLASNSDPEPGGWERVANLLHNAGLLEVAVESIEASDLKSELARAAPARRRPTLLHLTDTLDFDPTPEEMTHLKAALDAGHLLLFDAAGGSAAATSAFDGLMRELYPGRVTSAPLPPDHPAYGGPPAGSDDPVRGTVPVRTAEFRLPASGAARPAPVPRLRGYTAEGRLVAIASEDDLSAALVGSPVAVRSGYAPADAARLVGNVLLWVASGGR